MSASRNRTLGAIMASAAMIVLAACGGGDDGADSTPKTPKKPAASDKSGVTPSATPTSSTFGRGLVVARCYVDDGVLKLELNDFKVSSSDSIGQKVIDWQSTDMHTSSVGGCGGRYMAAGYSPDYAKLYVSRFDPAGDVYAVGFLDMNSGGYTQLTKSSSDAFAKVSEMSPSVNGNRVYFWDMAGEDPALKSMKLDGTGSKDEAALQKKYDEQGPNPSDFRTTDPYMVPGLSKPVIASDANDETAYTSDGTTWARMEASGPVSITKGGKTVEYNWSVPGNPPNTVAGQYRMGGFLPDGSVVFSDGAQIYRGKPAGEELGVSVIVKNSTESTVDDLTVDKKGDTIAFTYFDKAAQATRLYTVPVAGGTPKPLTDFPVKDMQGSVRILAFNNM